MSVTCLVEVLGVLEQEQVDPEWDHAGNITKAVQSRRGLADLYEALPVYGSAAFWHALEKPDILLEMLVHCVRTAMTYNDNIGRNHILEVIIRRTQTTNEYWAKSVLKNIHLQADEHRALVSDLYADLCEYMIRSLMDQQRLFWEENFQHCLRFERQHVYQVFMAREGRMSYRHVRRSGRVPRSLMASLDRFMHNEDGEAGQMDIEDKQAQLELLAVEQSDLLRLVLELPENLRSVVLLIFWEGRSERDTARILGITDRTVRNRLYGATQMLRNELASEGGNVYG